MQGWIKSVNLRWGVLPTLFYDRRISRNAYGKRPRTRKEIDAERKALREKAEREIDQLHADYLAKFGALPRLNVAVVYARYSTRHQDSISDQVRVLLDYALHEGLFVPREKILFDLAISGVRRNRAGLEIVETALRAKEAGTLLLFATNRLFRKIYHTLQFIDQFHRALGIRCVFVKCGVDTNDKQKWELLLYTRAMMDQLFTAMYIANIHAAHEGMLAKQIVFGTLSFGYAGEPIEGQLTKRGKPCQRIVIEPIAAGTVRQIYRWYVTDRLALAAIVRRLNAEPDAPLPPCSRSGIWTKLAVRTLLKNSRYRGLWKYGVVESVYLPDKDYFRQRARVEPLAQVELPELRIVTDELWFAAQTRLEARKNNGGRKSAGARQLPRLFNGMLYCPGHAEPVRLQVSGQYGRSMHCPVCDRLPANQRYLYSDVNRVVTTKLLSEGVQRLLLADPEMPNEVVQVCQREAELFEEQDPARLRQLEASIKQADRSIEFTRRSVGPAPEDEAAALQTIRQLQSERAAMQAELQRLRDAEQSVPRIPTSEEVLSLLNGIADQLVAAATASNEELGRAQAIVEMVTGGMIEIHQMGERKKYHGWPQARFKVTLLPYLVQMATGRPCTTTFPAVEIAIDLRECRAPNPKEEQAWLLYKHDKLMHEIAEALNTSKSNATILIKKACKRHGEQYVDGRLRRGSLKKRQAKPTKAENIKPEMVRLLIEGDSLKAISRKLQVSHDTVTKVFKEICDEHAMTEFDARTCKAQLVALLTRGLDEDRSDVRDGLAS
jgi:DNA invertase Pin-like site-specific DNA recombinase